MSKYREVQNPWPPPSLRCPTCGERISIDPDLGSRFVSADEFALQRHLDENHSILESLDQDFALEEE